VEEINNYLGRVATDESRILLGDSNTNDAGV